MSKLLSYILVFFFYIFLSSCLSTKPRVTATNNVETSTGYIGISKPFYKKKVNFIGGLFCVSLAGAGGYYGYNYESNTSINSNVENNNQILYTAGGAIGGYLVSRLLLKIIGNHKITYLKNDSLATKWVNDYNDYKYKDWILTKYPLPKKDTFLVISKTRKNNFIPSNINDVRNYSNVFNDSIYLNFVIDNVNPKITKLELDTIINEYPNQSSIFNSKIEFVNRSRDEKECFDAIEKFKEVQEATQKKYAELVSTLGFAKDFYSRYPKSNYLDFVFNRIYPKFNKYEIEFLVDLYNEVNIADKKRARKIIYENTNDIDTLLSKLIKYQDEFCEVNPYSKYDETFEEAKTLYSSVYNCDSIKTSNKNKIVQDIKSKFLNGFYQESKGRLIYSKLLYEYVTKESWMIDSSNYKIVDSIILEYCNISGNPHFTGRKVKGEFVGYGKLYTKNRTIEIGNFKNSKLNGEGKIINSDLVTTEGTFVNGKLEGYGREYDSKREIKGLFMKGDQNGEGERNYKNGIFEKGYYKFDLLNGRGEKKWPNNNTYNGDFKDGNLNGSGTFFWTNDNMKFVGNFTDGKRNGNGVMYLPNGYILKAIWLNDCIENGEYIIRVDTDLENSKPYSKIKIENCKILSSDVTLDFDQNLIFKTMDWQQD